MPNHPRHPHPDALRAVAARLAKEDRDLFRRIAFRRGADEERAEEAVSQAFVQLLRFYQGPAEVAQARSYLIACLHDAIYKQRRTYARRDAPLVVPRDGDGLAVDAASLGRCAGADPLEQVIDLEEAAVGRSLLRELPSEWRAILVLGAAGYSHAEIADRLGLSARQIRKRVSKANARLAELRRERGA